MLDPSHPLATLLREDRRYPLAAYGFVYDALQYAQEVLGFGAEVASEEDSDEGSPSAAGGEATDQVVRERHVTGQELCEAARRLAIDQFGLMAKSVLNHWGIRSTDDFGEMVWNLIDLGVFGCTPSDRREDFHSVYSFHDAFVAPYLPGPVRKPAATGRKDAEVRS